MGNLWDRIEARDGGPVLCGGLPLAGLIDRLEAGEASDGVAGALGLPAADVVAGLARAALGESEEDGPALVQEAPRRPHLAGALGADALLRLLPQTPRPALLALTAGLLQVHDFWDASHDAAQEADTLGESAVSAYWHGIAHRREPDPGNAAYWFRAVGRHAVFGPLAESARPLLDAHGDPALTGRLLRGGSWDPRAMIDLCCGARAGSAAEALARRLQRREMILLLEATASACRLVG
jgi:hypothetical protein